MPSSTRGTQADTVTSWQSYLSTQQRRLDDLVNLHNSMNSSRTTTTTIPRAPRAHSSLPVPRISGASRRDVEARMFGLPLRARDERPRARMGFEGEERWGRNVRVVVHGYEVEVFMTFQQIMHLLRELSARGWVVGELEALCQSDRWVVHVESGVVCAWEQEEARAWD